MNAVAIMAKAPLPNQVKTRLTPPLEPEEASYLYPNFLLGKIEQVKSVEARRFVAYTPKTSEAFFKGIMYPGFSLISQVGADIGERLTSVSKRLFAQGAEKVVMLDSDTPNLPTDHITEGLSLLDELDVVLGPCEDGGYYLIGMRSFVPELFRGIPWSTSEVAQLTVKKAQALDLTVSLLDRWYDMDTIKDLERLKIDLEQPADNCFFYRKWFREHGINPSQVRTHEDLRELPVISGRTIRENQPPESADFQFKSVDWSSVFTLHETIGTSGTPKHIVDRRA